MSERVARHLAPLVLVACAGTPPTPTKFSGKSTRVDVALQTAAKDLQCPLPELSMVAQGNRRYLNGSSFHYVVEGCGERAGYFETCELLTDPVPEGFTRIDDDLLACRNLLMTRLRIAPARAPEATPPNPEDAGSP